MTIRSICRITKRKESILIKFCTILLIVLFVAACYGIVQITRRVTQLRLQQKIINQKKLDQLQTTPIPRPIYISSEKKIDLSDVNKCKLRENVDQDTFNIDGVNYPRYVPLYYNKSLDFECMNKNKRRKRILLWNTFVGTNDYHYGLGSQTPFNSNKCPVNNCELTNDRSLLNESDFVVIYVVGLADLPKHKFDFQKWVFLVYESPIHSENFTYLNGLFDLSSTFRLDSDTTSIYFSQSTFYYKMNSNYDSERDFHATKTRFAAALISNCNDKSNRLEYIKEMQKYISIDIFGACSGRQCPFDCKAVLTRRYMFYFSFENSYCKDYITEKFFGVLRYDIVPVVLGAGRYDLFVPKSGYISAMDFESPEKLAGYLSYLSKNKTAYNAYFKWKKYVVFDSFNPFHGHVCEWCILLNMNTSAMIKPENMADFDKFWNYRRDCRSSVSEKKFEYISFDNYLNIPS